MDNITGREMHDSYCLIIGLYGLLAPPIVYQKFMKNMTARQVHRLLRSVYYVATLGFVLPTLLGVTLELSAIIPVKCLDNNLQFPPRLHLPQAWCLGLLVGRLMLFFSRSKDVNEPVNLINKLCVDGFETISFSQFNRAVVKPIIIAFGVMFVVPTVIANYSTKVIERLGYDFINSAYIRGLSHFWFLAQLTLFRYLRIPTYNHTPFKFCLKRQVNVCRGQARHSS